MWWDWPEVPALNQHFLFISFISLFIYFITHSVLYSFCLKYISYGHLEQNNSNQIDTDIKTDSLNKSQFTWCVWSWNIYPHQRSPAITFLLDKRSGTAVKRRTTTFSALGARTELKCLFDFEGYTFILIKMWTRMVAVWRFWFW